MRVREKDVVVCSQRVKQSFFIPLKKFQIQQQYFFFEM